MDLKIFTFGKTQKTPHLMEKEIGDHLSTRKYKYALQNENPNSGRISLSIVTDDLDEDDSADTRVKIFRTQRISDLENQLNEFLNGPACVKFKFITQSLSSNTIITIVFYDIDTPIDESEDDNDNGLTESDFENNTNEDGENE